MTLADLHVYELWVPVHQQRHDVCVAPVSGPVQECQPPGVPLPGVRGGQVTQPLNVPLLHKTGDNLAPLLFCSQV